MVSKLPDEFFRRRPEEAAGAGAADEPANKETSAPTLRKGSRTLLLPTAAAVVLTLGAVVLGYLITALIFLWMPGTGQAAPRPTSTESVAPKPTQKAGLYDGPTIAISPTEWESDCEGGEMDWRDGRGSWTCPGDGVGKRLRFKLEPAEELVGVRLIGGNDATVDEFEAERRITAVRWRFSDGSWFDQGLPSDTVLTQEVGFPPVEATNVEIEILSSTEPGSDWGDAVTISQFQFLAAA